jgi:hypothetical protein
MRTFTWYEVSSILLVEKQMYKDDVTLLGWPVEECKPPVPASADQKEGKPYFGWIELSFDKAKKFLYYIKLRSVKNPIKLYKAGC